MLHFVAIYHETTFFHRKLMETAMKILICFVLLLPTCLFAQTELITNGNFSNSSGWSTSGNWIISSTWQCYNIGPGYAFAGNSSGGAEINESGDLLQKITIPSTASSATFSFYASKSTDETSTTTVYDYVNVYLLNGNGIQLMQFPDTHIDNLYSGKPVTHCDGYSFKSFSIDKAYYGQPIWIDFRVHSDGGPKNTMFRIDDVSLVVTTNGLAPTASFTISQSSITQGETITITNTSTGNPSPTYSWSVSPSTGVTISNSITATPSISFQNAGSYTVTLTATNASGSNSKSTVVTVNSINISPKAIFSVSKTSITPGETITTTNSSTGTPAPSFQWSVNPMTSVVISNSTVSNPSITFNQNGTYTVTLTAQNSAGSDAQTTTINVSNGGSVPTASFALSKSSLLTGETITTTNTSSGNPTPTYSWSVVPSTSVDISPSAIAINPSIKFGAAGTYTVTMTATNTSGSNQASQTVVVSDGPTGLVDTWPNSGNELIANFQSNSEFDLTVNIPNSAQATRATYSFVPTNGVGTDSYTLTATDPLGAEQVFDNVTSYTFDKTSPTSGNWFFKLRSHMISGGTVTIHIDIQSTNGKFQTICYARANGISQTGKVHLASIQSFDFLATVAVATGVCADDDYMCNAANGGVGLIPYFNTYKDKFQFIVDGILTGAFRAVAFFTNNPDADALATAYLKQSLDAGTGILLDLPDLNALAQVEKYGPALAKLVTVLKKERTLTDLTQLGSAALHYLDNVKRAKYTPSPSLSANYLDKAMNANTITDYLRYSMASKWLTDLDGRFAPTTFGDNGDGIGVQLWAQPQVRNGPKDLHFDYSTIMIGSGNGAAPVAGYQKYAVMAVVMKDLVSGNIVVHQITPPTQDNGGMAISSPQLLKIRLAAESSPVFRTQLGVPSATNVEILGSVSTSQDSPSSIGKAGKRTSGFDSTVDSVYYHHAEPTIPFVDGFKMNSNGDLEMKFHTSGESENKGWFIKRATEPDDTIYTTISPLLYGWTNTTERHDYVFTDETFDSTKAYRYLITQVNTAGFVAFISDTFSVSKTTLTGVEDAQSLPRTYQLSEAFPNPFNPVTTIKYQNPENQYVLLTVFDVLGREVSVLVNGIEQPGFKSVTWNATNIPSGVYFYRMTAGAFTDVKKVVLMR
jgi:PKD repeat protein